MQRQRPTHSERKRDTRRGRAGRELQEPPQTEGKAETHPGNRRQAEGRTRPEAEREERVRHTGRTGGQGRHQVIQCGGAAGGGRGEEGGGVGAGGGAMSSPELGGTEDRNGMWVWA